MPEVGGRAGPEVIREGELPLNSTSYSTKERRPSTLPGQHNTVNTISRDVGEPVINL